MVPESQKSQRNALAIEAVVYIETGLVDMLGD
jgi:hypothetical protein